MIIFTNKVIPIDRLSRGESVDLRKVVESAKEHPWYFLGELFSLTMMIIGVYVVGEWVYQLGHAFGRSIG